MGSISGPSRRVLTVGLALALLTLVGCGGKRTYPIEGTIVIKDNAVPVENLKGYVITLESVEDPLGANGTVDGNGHFKVGTFKDGDGAVLGKHRVSLMPPQGGDGNIRGSRMTFPSRYWRLDTSGLEIMVDRGVNKPTLEIEMEKR